MVAFTVVVLYVLAAIAGAVPGEVRRARPARASQPGHLLDVSLGGIPKGNFGGISSDHPLGVEPGTGRDVLSRIWYGITFSLAIALSATLLAVVVGAVHGHHRRRSAAARRRHHRSLSST